VCCYNYYDSGPSVRALSRAASTQHRMSTYIDLCHVTCHMSATSAVGHAAAASNAHSVFSLSMCMWRTRSKPAPAGARRLCIMLRAIAIAGAARCSSHASVVLCGVLVRMPGGVCVGVGRCTCVTHVCVCARRMCGWRCRWVGGRVCASSWCFGVWSGWRVRVVVMLL